MANKLKRGDRLNDSPLTIRVAPELLERLDALIEPIAADSITATVVGGASRSSVTRLALVEGLRVLERRYPTTRKVVRGRR